MSIPAWWGSASAELIKRDPVLGAIIREHQAETLVGRGDAFSTFLRAIIGQQISVKAADSVWARLQAQFPELTPMAIHQASTEQLRGCGLSCMKCNYMHNLAAFFVGEPDVVARWRELDDEPLMKDIIKLHGIGRWTAEMFLIFHLQRSDILPLGDLGLVKAMWNLYNGGQPLPKERLVEIAEVWRPWRTVATWYLWRSLDPVAINY